MEGEGNVENENNEFDEQQDEEKHQGKGGEKGCI